MRIAGRRSVRRAVLNRVDRTTRSHQSDEDLVERTLPLVAAGVDALVARVCATAGAPAPGRRRRNSKQLLPSDLVRLLANPGGYVCHRTDREDVGTCQVPLTSETRRIRAVPGVRGDGRGLFGVVYTRHLWTAGEGSSVLCEAESLGTDEAVGWYVREDLDEAARGQAGTFAR